MSCIPIKCLALVKNVLQRYLISLKIPNIHVSSLICFWCALDVHSSLKFNICNSIISLITYVLRYWVLIGVIVKCYKIWMKFSKMVWFSVIIHCYHTKIGSTLYLGIQKISYNNHMFIFKSLVLRQTKIYIKHSFLAFQTN